MGCLCDQSSVQNVRSNVCMLYFIYGTSLFSPAMRFFLFFSVDCRVFYNFCTVPVPVLTVLH